MHSTELINYVIAAIGASFPITYLLIVNRCIKGDLQRTDKIAEEPGQTHNTAILDLHAPDGHAAHAATDEPHHAGLAFAH